MAGNHIFTSSLWVQSGSAAEFKTGMVVSNSLSVEGTVTATNFIGDGSGLTGLFEEDFFAGDPAYQDGANPISKDIYVSLYSGQLVANASDIEIHTTSSLNFEPNHYAFYKLTDAGFESLQSGATDHYIGTDNVPGGDLNGTNPYLNDLAPGVHRYMVYASNTTSGQTKNLFTTITIYAFVNIAPVVELAPHNNIVIPHDSSSASIIVDFSDTSDANIDLSDTSTSDFLRKISVALSTGQHTDTSNHNFNSKIDHDDDTISSILIDYQTTVQGGAYNPLSEAQLHATLSVDTYSVLNPSGEIISNDSQNISNTYITTITDNNIENNLGQKTFTVGITPPPTASIRNINLSLNADAYSNTEVTSITTPMLFDKVFTELDITGLPDRYTSSLVRLKMSADIIEPGSYVATPGHDTDISISSASIADVSWNQGNSVVGTFRIVGGSDTASKYAVNHGSTYSSFATDFKELALKSGQHYIGTIQNSNDINNINKGIRHGTNNHYNATPSNVVTVDVTPIPDITVTNINIELEADDYQSNLGSSTRTAQTLYGYTSSLLLGDIPTLQAYSNYRATHLSESVIRYRISATVTEPFGPDHRNITIQFKNGATNLNSVSLNTSSAETTVDHSYDALDRLVADYTSSWQVSAFTPGTHNITAAITSNASNAGLTVESTSPAVLTMTPIADTIILNPRMEVESGSYNSGEGANIRTAKILHGNTATQNSNNAAWNQESKDQLVRVRFLVDRTEPFGPYDAETIYYNSDGGSDLFYVNSSSAATSNMVNGRFETAYTSSWEVKTLPQGNNQQINPVFTKHDNIYGGGNVTGHANYTHSYVTVNAADDSIISATITPNVSHWSQSNAQVALDDYLVSNGANTIHNKELSINIVATQPTHSTLLSMDSSKYTVAWTDNDSNFSTVGSNATTAYVDITGISGYTNIDTATITATISSSVVGDSATHQQTQVLNVLPHDPVTLDGVTLTDNISLVTAYLPSSSGWNYKPDHAPGTLVNNVFRTYGAANSIDYAMQLNVDGDFDYAESGSLELWVNGILSCSIDLGSNFDNADKDSTQTLRYNGPLSLISWGVHNNISQPIYNGTELLPVGYQKYTPRIAFSSKIRDGYNSVYLKRTFTGNQADQITNTYEWYYDDGVGQVNINIPTPNVFTWNILNATSPTMSLSGVKYFKKGVEFAVSYSGHIEGLVNETYESETNLGTVNPAGDLTLYSNGSFSKYARAIDPGDGLTWDSGKLAPEIGDTASIAYKAKYTGTSPTPEDLDISLSIPHRISGNAATSPMAGRFIDDTTLTTSTTTTENMEYETYRLAIGQTSSFGDTQSDYTYWVTSSNCTYDSNQDISSTTDLHMKPGVGLVYPNTDYSAAINPNNPDYTSLTGDKYFYRAFNVQNINLSSASDLLLKIKIGTPSGNPITQSDIWANDPTNTGTKVDYDSLPIRLRVKMPGPIQSQGLQSISDPGTEWSAICGGTISGANPTDNIATENWFAAPGSSYSYSNGYISILWDTGTSAIQRAGGVGILEVRMKATATASNHVITSIQIEDGN